MVGTTLTDFVVKRVELLGNRDDVLVVRQHDHLVGVDGLDRGEQFGGRRVQRLSARDHALHPELTEQLGQPVAAGHSNDRARDGGKAEGRRRMTVAGSDRRLTHGVLLGYLLEQIGDPDLLGTPVQLQRNFDRCADVVGVDVAVPQPVSTDDDDRVADLDPMLP